jgi:hypothetical protein
MLPFEKPIPSALSETVVRQLASSLFADASDERGPKVRRALAAMCLEAHARGLPAETVVTGLKTAWRQAPTPRGMTTDQWAREYYDVLGECMILFFGPAA